MSSKPVENATTSRGRTFPAEWGQPAGTPHSEARAAWVREQVARHGAVTGHRVLDVKQARLLAILQAAALNGRKDGP